MPLLRALVFWPVFLVVTLAFALAGIPTLVLHRDATYRLAILWARSFLWLARTICGLGWRVEGAEHRAAAPAVYALKHQSAWETIAFIALGPPVAGVLKRELLVLPIYGWYLTRLGMIPIDRKAGGSALRDLLRRTQAALDSGRSIMIMPEGTRVAPGRSGRYHPGVAALYDMLRLPVVPVALNSGLFWRRRSLILRPGTVVLEYLPPIEPGLDRRGFITELQSRIETASERLRLEALAARPPEA